MTTLFDIEKATGKDITTITEEINVKETERMSLEDVLKNEIEVGTLVSIKRNTFRGVVKLLGMVYDYTRDKSSVWVETSEDIFNVGFEEVEIERSVNSQAKCGFNAYKTKLTEQAVRDIYLMATTTNMSHPAITNWVLVYHGIEIVPKTVSDIKLGKRWGKLTSTIRGGC